MNNSEVDARAGVSGFRKVGFIAVAGCFSVVLALLGGEAIVRLFATTYTLEQMAEQAPQYAPAVFTRHKFVPAQTVMRIGADPATAVHINSKGFRGQDFASTKPTGTTRVLFLGGSATYSITPGAGKDWPHRAVAYLRDRGIDAECINAGVPGHDTADSVGKLLTELWMYQPDYVVLYQGYNDQKYFAKVTRDQPYRHFVRPYRPERDVLTHATGLDGLMCYSKLYLELRYRYLHATYTAEGLRRSEIRNVTDQLNPEAIEQYRMNVRAICDLARNASAQPVLCLQGRLVNPDNTPEEKERLRQEFIGLTHEAWCRAFGECDRIIQEVAEEKGVPVIDVAAQVTGQPALFRDHIHMTAEGDEVVGRIVGEGLYKIIQENEKTVAQR